MAFVGEKASQLISKVQEHKILAAVFVVLGLAGLGRAFGGLEKLKGLLAILLSKGVQMDPAKNTFVVSDWYAWGAFGLLAALLIAFLLCLAFRKERNEAKVWLAELHQKVERRNAIVEKTFEKMMLAASQIGSQLYPATRQPQKRLIRVRRTYFVYDNFDTAVTREDEYKAVTDLYIEQIIIGAEPDAEPCEFLDSIDFKVRDENRLNQVAYLPTRNSPFEKHVLLFFLPRITPGEATPRKIVVSYKWPKMFRQLETKGFEIGKWVLKSIEPIPSAEKRVFFHPSLKNRVLASIQGIRIAGDSLERQVCDVPGFSGWEGYCYTLRNAPAGSYEIRFEFK